MNTIYKNLIFEGGGVLGIAYLGVLDYLTSHNLINDITKVAGTSAGAITACVLSFNLPFKETKAIADSLDFREIPQKSSHPAIAGLPGPLRKEMESIFGDLDCLYRLLHNFGWYSSEYFYEWLQEQIAAQFDQSKKLPPYTFADFKNTEIHKDKRKFHDLYVVGTDISTNSSRVFCYETTPNLEVATAVRISMSIPFFFESIPLYEKLPSGKTLEHIFSDGGVMRNYPINLFDNSYFNRSDSDVNFATLGSRFISNPTYNKINNLEDYIVNLVKSYMNVQKDAFRHNKNDVVRSIQIDPGDISFTDFDIEPGDEKYKFLYEQGYKAADRYFS